jgi:hypothetical protein
MERIDEGITSEVGAPGFAIEPKVCAASGSDLVHWSLAKRVLFRFVFAYFILSGFPFPADRVPVIDGWVDDVYYGPLQNLAAWMGKFLLGRVLSVAENGRDRTVDFIQLFFFMGIAAGATVIWSILDARRTEYVKLHAFLRVYVRYLIIFPLFVYAAVKLVKIQFPDPEPDALLQMYGESSPGRLLWMFMGHSPVYSTFIGVAELLAAALLCFRRTTTLGALVAAATLLNVVILNFCFPGVGVKLMSSSLLAMSLFLLAPDFGRLLDVLVFNRSSKPVPLGALPSVKWMRQGRLVLKMALIGLAAFSATKPVVKYRKPPPHALYGIYDVEAFVRNGEERPLLITDGSCWRRMIVNTYGWLTIQFINDKSVRYRTKTDAGQHTLKLRTWDDGEGTKGTLNYGQEDPDHLSIEGTVDGDAVRVRLRKVDRRFPLVEAKFQWSYDGPVESSR